MESIYKLIAENQHEKLADEKRKIDNIIYTECGFGDAEIERIEENLGRL